VQKGFQIAAYLITKGLIIKSKSFKENSCKLPPGTAVQTVVGLTDTIKGNKLLSL